MNLYGVFHTVKSYFILLLVIYVYICSLLTGLINDDAIITMFIVNMFLTDDATITV